MGRKDFVREGCRTPASPEVGVSFASGPTVQLVASSPTGEANSALAGLLPTEIDAVLPMPAADVMLGLLEKLGA